MFYDENGAFYGVDPTMVTEIEPGTVIFSDGVPKVVTHAIHIGPDTYKCTFEDNTSEVVMHYGTPRHSGRYPWGSGDNPYQRNDSFLRRVDELKKAKDENGKKIFTEKQIAESMGMNTSELRKQISLANAENRAYVAAEAKRLKEKGMSTSAIARRMGRNESSVRLLLDEGVSDRMSKSARNAQILKDRLNEEDGTYIQVGRGTEYYLGGASSTSLNNTLALLKKEGYTVHDIPVEQLGTGKTTTVKVLAKPGVEWKEIMNNKSGIKLPVDIYTEDGGTEFRKVEPYKSISRDRVMINYAEDGGVDKDGVIELRRGVPDLDLGRNHYAQVRILVDGNKYLKGMAMYADDLPPGVDIRFNTNKHKDKSFDEVLKDAYEKGEDNPFGANIKPEEDLTKAQRHYIDENGQEQLSALNIVKEEGDVNKWSRNLASQFLSKQPPKLAEQQLKLAYDISKSEFDEIASYENPTVKAKMLEDFAGRCDSDAVHLQAAALPRQKTAFILPLDNVGDTEIYAPRFRDGEQVALVRYPHAGGFEIPIFTVNNNNAKAKSVIGDAIDAVGINKTAADRLSGADFDGDTVLVIPVDNLKLRASANKRSSAFQSLEGFDPKEEYKGYPGMHVMTDHQKGVEMGKITNLITDMYAGGAPDEELCRAVRHSMTVIDAKKHKLDFRRSERENRIPELREKWQPNGGASTLLSRTTSDIRVNQRKEKAPSKMTPEELERYKNGEIVWEYSTKPKRVPDYKASMTKEEKELWDSGPEGQKEVKARLYAEGRVKYRESIPTITSTKGAENDPYKLVSGGSREKTTDIERIYADHALAMKDLARQARKLAREQVEPPRDPEATKRYSAEVASIEAKLQIAKKNAPLERQAQLLANEKMRTILYNNPELKKDKEHYKREKGRQLDYYRRLVGAKKLIIGSKDNPLTEREWEAIQNRAVSKTTLRGVLANADMGRVRQLAMPKVKTGIPQAKLSRAKNMLNKGYTRAEIADMLDIPEGKLVYAMENGDL